MQSEVSVQVVGHRTRVAAERRQRMRARLVEAAFLVFGQRGVEASVIDEITSQAGVSRGTFYNYFRTNEEALRAVAIQAGDELMEAVAPVVEAHPDPAYRVSAGVRSWLYVVQDHPNLAAFFRRSGLYVLEQDTRVRRDLPRDLIAGVQSGRFTISDLDLGFVIVAGTVLAATNAIATGPMVATYPDNVAERILLALGIGADEAKEISGLPLDRATLPADSLAVRAEGAVGSLLDASELALTTAGRDVSISK